MKKIAVAVFLSLIVGIVNPLGAGHAEHAPPVSTPEPGALGNQPMSGSEAAGDESQRADSPPIRLRVGTFVPAQDETLNLPSDLRITHYPAGVAGYYLVQFHGPIQRRWKQEVESLGAVLLDYIPDFAFIVQMDQATVGAVEALEEVLWVGPYQPAYKLSPDLEGAEGAVEVVVLTFPTGSTTDIVSQARSLGASIQDVSANAFGGTLRLSTDAAELGALARMPDVHWIEPAYEMVLFNDVARSSAIMDAESVWADLGLYGQGQTVAVADTGLDTGDLATLHDDFRGTPTGCSGTGRVLATYALGRSGDWSDSCRYRDGGQWVNSGGHGTHVAGSVLGNGCNSTSGGTPDYSGSHAGLAPQANLVFQSVMDSGCGLGGLPADLNDLFSQAAGAGATIHTNSWGADVDGQYTTDSRNTDVYMWNNKGFTILFAAANAGVDGDSDGRVDLDSLAAPGTAKNCITVGATENNRPYGGLNPEHSGDPFDEVQCTTGPAWGDCWGDYPANPIHDDYVSDDDTGMAAFSSRGPTDDGRIKPDVVAPGTNILSTKSQGQYVSGGWGPGENQYYQFMGGTSMATPLTAGGAALVRQFYTDVEGITPSAALIKATLINSAVDVYPGQYGSRVEQWPDRLPNNVQGWGRVNLGNATDGTHSYVDVADGNGLDGSPGHDTHTYTYTLCTSNVFKVTLVWTDYPGSTTADGALVNDLDLIVESPDGTTYLGNVFSNGWSVAGGTADRTNNVESVYMNSPATGVWTVTVDSYNVPQGTLPGYALVVDMPDNVCDPDFTLDATPETLDVCMSNDAVFDVDLGSIADFSDPVDLSTSGRPGGTTGAFSVDPVTPPGSSVLTIGDTGSATPGTYDIDVIGASGSLVHSDTVTLNLLDSTPGTPGLSLPADGSLGASTSPTFEWSASPTASTYDIEIATDPYFGNVVDLASGLTSLSYTPGAALNTDTVYYWRVRANNACGSGAYSAPSAFRTGALTAYTSCSTPNVSIPDATGESVSDDMLVTDSGPINDLDVYLDVTHTWVGDLVFTVEDVDGGTSATIIDRPGVPASTYGCSGDNIDVTLDDEGTSPVEDFCSDSPALYGNLIPNSSLTQFDGAEFSGNWRITATDYVSPDPGTLNQWCLVGTVFAVAPADYSDLNSSYGVAAHRGNGALRLGSNWTADSGFTPPGSDDDDDGVALDANTGWEEGATVTVYVTVTGGSGYVAGWFDWNRDGDFADTGEQAIGQNVTGSVGGSSNAINFTIPTGVGYTAGEEVNGRFRLYDAEPTRAPMGIETPHGDASSGEVEDSRFTPPVPTAVELLGLEAARDGQDVVLTWQTVSEIDLLGFNLYRRSDGEATYTMLNHTLILAENPGSHLGAVYTWRDGGLSPGTYLYRLEDEGPTGLTGTHGPVSVTVPYAVYLPAVLRQ